MAILGETLLGVFLAAIGPMLQAGVVWLLQSTVFWVAATVYGVYTGGKTIVEAKNNPNLTRNDAAYEYGFGTGEILTSIIPFWGRIKGKFRGNRIETGAKKLNLERSALSETGMNNSVTERIVKNEKSLQVHTSYSSKFVEKAEFIREIKKGERVNDIIEEAKYLTRSDGVEHAVIKLNGKRYMVRGGRDGIQLPSETEIIFGHTHPNLPGSKPFNNGPSSEDRDILNLINDGQSKQYVFHDGQRTTIYRNMGSEFDVSTTNY